MSPIVVVCAAIALVAAGACSSGEPDAAARRDATPSPVAPRSPSPSPTFDVRTVIIEGDEGPVIVTAEAADTPEERQVGLMFRDSLDADRGMLFVFFEPTTSGFWMKDTLIPLSIAFFDRDGRIVDIEDMDPCEREPCPVYASDEPYVGALEVNQGFFDRNGIDVGDVVEIAP
ncbi:MAG TPA: DUF192 domain-containing protein [Actinomycetota bacterium]|nr:DUF192 domain-containing protein [Actinomycetota bacterium]